MPRISSLITKGFNTPYVVPGHWRIPQGAIIMYSGTADPGLPGWTRYSAADGRFIKGTATQAEIGTVAANNHATWQQIGYVVSTGQGGYHSGPAANYQGNPPQGAQQVQLSTEITYTVGAGDHSHTLVLNVGEGNNFDPYSTNYILLEATQEHKKFPINTVVASGTQPLSGTQQVTATQQVSNGANRYIKGGTSYANADGVSRSFSGSTDSYGPHQHGGGSYIGIITGGSRSNGISQTPNVITASSHYHTLFGTITSANLPGKLLKIWKLAEKLIPDDNIIIMYTGNISSLPSYWKVCDGSYGTPNMVNYFLGYSYAGTAHNTETSYAASVSTGGLNTESWSHSHISANQTFRIGYPQSNLHTTFSATHSHTLNINVTATEFTSSNEYKPDEIKLCFIQLTKTLY
jgi:hypothetical protein